MRPRNDTSPLRRYVSLPGHNRAADGGCSDPKPIPMWNADGREVDSLIEIAMQ